MQKSTLEAYLDAKDTILIVTNKESSFTINGVLLPVLLCSKDSHHHYYLANYPIELGNYYVICDDDGNETYLTVRYFIKEDSFDELYFYDKDDLGPTYSKKETTFKLWAPTAQKVTLKYEVLNKTYQEEMIRTPRGVFEITIHKDLKNALYTYLVSINNEVNEALDPYAYSSNSNSKKSAVIDLKSFNKVPLNRNILKRRNDAIIYELSIRDFSMDGSFGENEKCKFTALCKNGVKSKHKHPIGLDYLKDLGVTHIQLQPVLDFLTVNEDDIFEKYNWGYDPFSYNTLEGSYSSNPNNPYTRMEEFIQLVSTLHEAGLFVTLDVVFNHTYLFKKSNFNKIVPNYFYLMDRHGHLSNGSYCGNDIDSLRKMVIKYLVDMSKRLVSIYHVDGFRYDLMGILDKDVVLTIDEECKKMNPSFFSYGEGWNMPSMMPEDKRASLKNANTMKSISFFNDTFRDTVSGKVKEEAGFLSGNIHQIDKFIDVMLGSFKNNIFESPISSINYVECHDNYTLYDKLKIIDKNKNAEQRNNIQLLNMAAIIFSLGVPFIHFGMELNRSKRGVENSYKSLDFINMVKWKDVDTHYKNVKALKDFIKIRKTYECFKMENTQAIRYSIDAKKIDGAVMFTYAISNIIIIFNPTSERKDISLYSYYRYIANQTGFIKEDDDVVNMIKVEPYSLAILSK